MLESSLLFLLYRLKEKHLISILISFFVPIEDLFLLVQKQIFLIEIRSLSLVSIRHWISDWPHKLSGSLCYFVSFEFILSHQNKKYYSFKLDMSML